MKWNFCLPCSPASGAEEPQQSFYDVLNVSLLASQREIKQQFRRLALQYHPDKAGCTNRWLAIREAFEVLSDRERRFSYDKTLVHCLDMQEYLSRFSELVLTVQGLSLPPHLAHLHSPSSKAVPAQQQPPHVQPRRCHQPQQPRQQAFPPRPPPLLTRC